jgi:FkbM family methyltransferase
MVWRVPGKRMIASGLRALPLPAGKWRLAHAIADLFASDGVPQTERVRLAHGFQMQLDLGDVVQRRMYFAGEYDPRSSRLFRQLLHPGDIAIDGGANIGYFSLLAARCVGDQGAVHAFEPVPRTFTLLLDNIEHNHFGNIQANCAALCDRTGVLQLRMAASANIGTATAVLPGSGPSVSAHALTLDEYAAQHAIGAIKLVKLDIEGSELSAIRGMRTLLSERRISYLICEVNPDLLDAQGIPPDALRREMAAYGYRCYRIRPLARLFPMGVPLPHVDADYLFAQASAPPSGAVTSTRSSR